MNEPIGTEENLETLDTGRSVGPAGNGRKRGGRGRFEAVLTEVERFETKVARSDQGGCDGWTGRLTPDGYPLYDLADGRTVRAHRWAWEQAHGPIPEGYTIDHLTAPDGPCLGPPCVKVDHLDPEPVTFGENTRRRHARRRALEALEAR